MDKSEGIKRLIRALKSAGCCPRCILRHVSVKEIDLYKSLHDVNERIAILLGEEKSENGIPKMKREKLSPCVACFGILQELCDAPSHSYIISAVKESDFQFKEFVLSLTIPLTSILQEHSIQVYMKRNFSEDYCVNTVPSVKEVWKWIIGASVEKEYKVTFNIHSPFDITVVTYCPDDGKTCEEMLKQFRWTDKSGKKNKPFLPSRGKVEKALEELEEDDIINYMTWPPSIPTASAIYAKIECFHKSLYVAGRYNKYSRKLSQTPWLINGEKLMDTSIKELICDKIERYFKADDVKFLASGREDVDVRTLGRGRPFALEFINPHRVFFDTTQLKSFQDEINESTSDIAVRDLQIVSRDNISKLKTGEEKKTKTYSALCHSRQSLSSEQLEILKNIKNLTVLQKTPIRVLHRRPLAVREKIIHEMKAVLIDENNFKLVLNTQAGTYIKEFVHSDFGRTHPSLGTLLKVETDIVELDVESVELDWPPSLED